MLKTHLFGDTFERDHLGWQSRELATMYVLSARLEAKVKLQAHFGISVNEGLTTGQLGSSLRC